MLVTTFDAHNELIVTAYCVNCRADTFIHKCANICSLCNYVRSSFAQITTANQATYSGTKFTIKPMLCSFFQATGIRLGTLIRNMSSVGVALGIGFYFSWKLSLVILAFAPLIAISGFLQSRLAHGAHRDSRINLEEAGKVGGI